MTRLVLFDIDGTLVDSVGAGRRSLRRAFEAAFGVTDYDGRTREVVFGGRTDPDITRDLARAVGIDPIAYGRREPELRERYFAELSREMSEPRAGRRVYPGVPALLDRLRSGSVELGLVTGNFERSARLKLDPFGLNPYFASGGFGCDDRDRTRIAAAARARAERRAGRRFEPAEVAVVGDTERDVACARANGFRAVAVRTGWAAPGELEDARPDALLDDLADLPVSLDALGLGDAPAPLT